MISDMEEEAKESRTSGDKSGLKPILETRSQYLEAVAAWKHKNMAWIADEVEKLVDLQLCAAEFFWTKEISLWTGLSNVTPQQINKKKI